ncbi:MAG: RDD family protein [Betaproteobacteria bacterium]|nr:RDD family protein [Betaproteobacteria bacterium]
MDSHSGAPDNPYLAPKTTIADIAPSGEIELAGRFDRLCASVLDHLILVATLILIFLIFFIMGVSEAIRSLDSTTWLGLDTWKGSSLLVLFSFVPPVLTVVFFFAINFPLLRKHGQTLGKYVFKVRIVHSDGMPAGVWQILLRRYLLTPIVLLIIMFGLIFIIGILMGLASLEGSNEVGAFIGMHFYFMVLVDILPIFRASRKCLHDTLADTVVVRA